MDRDETESLGRALQAARATSSLSQLKLSVATGLSTGRIIALEKGHYSRGRTQPRKLAFLTRSELELLAETLHTTPAAIADRDDLAPATRAG